MTGLLFALAPFVAACLVAGHDPRHQPVRDALGASALYSVAALPFVASHLDARARLALFALVAVMSGRAYARAFGWRWTESRICSSVLASFVGLMFFWCAPVSPWTIATWGPFVASTILGALALWMWWEARAMNQKRVERYLRWEFGEPYKAIPPDLRLTEPVSIAQRCAIVLLASDACMLAFVGWDGVQIWQGRAAAVAVALVQVVWLWRS